MISKSISHQVRKLLFDANPEGVRFIKLGRKSAWWPIAKQTNTIRLGFKTFDFRLCAAGEWDKARREYLKTSSRRRAADVTRAVIKFVNFSSYLDQYFGLPLKMAICGGVSPKHKSKISTTAMTRKRKNLGRDFEGPLASGLIRTSREIACASTV
jgi:hypothetical protein